MLFRLLIINKNIKFRLFVPLFAPQQFGGLNLFRFLYGLLLSLKCDPHKSYRRYFAQQGRIEFFPKDYPEILFAFYYKVLPFFCFGYLYFAVKPDLAFFPP